MTEEEYEVQVTLGLIPSREDVTTFVTYPFCPMICSKSVEQLLMNLLYKYYYTTWDVPMFWSVRSGLTDIQRIEILMKYLRRHFQVPARRQI